MSYIKTIMLGTLGTAENWSCGITWRNFELFPASMTQTMIESLSTRLVTAIPAASVPAQLKTLWSNSCNLTAWRVEQHGEDEALTNVGQASYATPVAGTGGASKSPQDALVVSLRTATPGARGRGRLYWPALGASLTTDFSLSSPSATNIALATAQLMKLVGDQINAEWAANSQAVSAELAVRSITDHTSRKVERLQVGSALDTQRRRRDKVIETYIVQAYPPA